MEEIWKPIKGYEGLYEVSNYGRIKSLHYYGGNRQVIMTPNKRHDGYLTVGLSKNKKVTTCTVHRIVASAFLPNTNCLEMVNHKDENKQNNCVDNLEWCTRSYNQIYSINLHEERRKVFADNFRKNGNKSPYTVKGKAHTCLRPVVQKDLNGNIVAKYSCPAEASNATGNGQVIMNCYLNESGKPKKRSHGIWKYVSLGFVYEFEDAQTDFE